MQFDIVPPGLWRRNTVKLNTGSDLRLSSLVALQTRVKSFSYSDSKVQKRDCLWLMALHLLVCLLMLFFWFDWSCIRCLSFVNFDPCISLFSFCLFARLTPKECSNLLVIWGISVWSLRVLRVLPPLSKQIIYLTHMTWCSGTCVKASDMSRKRIFVENFQMLHPEAVSLIRCKWCYSSLFLWLFDMWSDILHCHAVHTA